MASRDELFAQVAENCISQAEDALGIARGSSKVREHIAALEKERDAAVANNAELVTRLTHLLSVLWGPDFERLPAEQMTKKVIAQHHPGAALLERVKRLEERSSLLALVVEQIALENVDNPYKFARESLEKLGH